MYEGFSSYDVFVDSISDGFTNWLNEHMPKHKELLCNADGYSALCEVFGKKLSTKKLRGVNMDQIKQLQACVAEGCDLKLSEKQILECLRGALNQSTGNSQLDNF